MSESKAELLTACWCRKTTCLPSKGIERSQEHYAKLSQTALDAFHHAGAAWESLDMISRLQPKKKNNRKVIDIIDGKPLIEEDETWSGQCPDSNNLGDLDRAFVTVVKFKELSKKIETLHECLLFEGF
jgi:hypothetical protein